MCRSPGSIPSSYSTPPIPKRTRVSTEYTRCTEYSEYILSSSSSRLLHRPGIKLRLYSACLAETGECLASSSTTLESPPCQQWQYLRFLHPEIRYTFFLYLSPISVSLSLLLDYGVQTVCLWLTSACLSLSLSLSLTFCTECTS